MKRPIYYLLCAIACTSMRSEEHTSELQSPITISYAVFCLKKIFFNDTATTEIYTLSYTTLFRSVLDQLVGAFLLGGLVIPGTGEGNVHGDGGANGTGAQEEAGVAGDDLGVGVSTHIAHLGLVSGDLAVLDHLVQFHTGSNTGHVAALIDGSESVVVVGQALGVGLGAGGVAELHVREFLSSLDDVILVAEGIGEDDVAAGIGQLSSGIVALLALGDVGAEDRKSTRLNSSHL